MSNRYPVIDVSSATRDHIEPMGTKRKFWFCDADGARWLFKYSRPQTGEHWAEKIAAEIGVRLGIPVARVELGMCDGALGACSQSFLPAESALVHGNELLQEVDQTYPVTQLRGVSKHTVEAVFGQLLTMDPPNRVSSDAECGRLFRRLSSPRCSDRKWGSPPRELGCRPRHLEPSTRTKLRPRLLARP